MMFNLKLRKSVFIIKFNNKKTTHVLIIAILDIFVNFYKQFFNDKTEINKEKGIRLWK